jgi:hypothetical protein
MVLAALNPAREAELRQLLDSMNMAPGRVNANNALIPFAQLDALHFARLLILDDKTVEDTRVYGGGPPPTYSLYLAFLGDIDGEVDRFLERLVTVAGPGLRMIFSCCEGFTTRIELVRWMKQHSAPAIAAYVNWRGRTVRQVREEAALREAIENQIRNNAAEFNGRPAREIHLKLQQFVRAEKSTGRLAVSDESKTPTIWWIKNLLHLLGVPLVMMLALPLLIVLAPIILIRLRHLEKTDPDLCWRGDERHSDELSRFEDHDVTNQFTAMGSVKPGLVRRWILSGILITVDYAARHFVRRGRLGRIRTIHFARWVFLDRKKRMVFFSNYDGTVESYMDDFINKTGFGLNAVFSNGIGYPRTNWLVLDGCQHEQNYKNFLRRHTLPTQVWYKAYPGLTAIDLERNTRVRHGLESTSMSEQETREWVALL